MLQSIRDRTQGWIAGVIISLVILSFALWGIHSYIAGAGNTDVIAKVNGTEISKRQLAAAFERLRRQVQMNTGTGTVPDNLDVDLKRRALDALINIQVLKQASLAQNYRISPRQVEGYLESMPEFQVNGQFSASRFQQLLAATLYSVGDFLDLIGTTLLIDQPRLGIVLTSFALPNEVSDSYSLVNQERDIQYMRLPLDYFLNQNFSISNDEIQAYYQAHQSEFKTPEQVTIQYIELALNDLIANSHPTEDALKTFYNDNIALYTSPTVWTLEKILVPLSDNTSEQDVTAARQKAMELQEKISGGADFTALAHQYPAGDATTPVVATASQLSPEIQKGVMGLTKAGQISDPIKTSKGLLIIKASAIKNSEVQSFEQAKDKVQVALARQMAEEKFIDLKEKLANIAYEHPDSLEPAAKALGLTIKESSAFSLKSGGANDITSAKKIRDAAFTDDVLNSQNNSDLIQATPDSSVVLRIKSHRQAASLSLDAVRQQITDILKKKKADEKAEATANEIQKKLQAGASPDQIATQYNFSWDKLGFIGRYSTKVDSAILYTAFGLPKPKNDKAVSYATVKIPNGFAIVATNAIRNGKVADNKEQYDVFAEQIQASDATLEYKLYEKSLVDSASIKSQMDQVE
jgi:peptidyl-prolyl cis-trans isomerase D